MLGEFTVTHSGSDDPDSVSAANVTPFVSEWSTMKDGKPVRRYLVADNGTLTVSEDASNVQEVQVPDVDNPFKTKIKSWEILVGRGVPLVLIIIIAAVVMSRRGKASAPAP